MNVLYEDDFTQIRHDAAQNCIEWKVKSFIPSKELKTFFEKVYNYTEENNCDKNLVDMTKMGVIPEDVRDWFQEFWFPMMSDIGVKLFVLINSESVITQMSVNKMEEDIKGIKDKFGITTVYFDDIEKARSYISSGN